MREDICSIPINDVFLPKDGCPFCRMRDMLEDRMATYITGAAMMEPDVRVETNRLGFCSEHFSQILSRGQKLPVALILESLLDEVRGDVFPEGKINPKKTVQAVKRREESCFICENIEKNREHLMKSFLNLWRTDPDFKKLYAEQPFICLKHYGEVMEASSSLPKKELAEFEEVTTALAKNYLTELKADVTHFCRMFDYRNAGGDWGNSRDASERAIEWLTSRKPEVLDRADEKNR